MCCERVQVREQEREEQSEQDLAVWDWEQGKESHGVGTTWLRPCCLFGARSLLTRVDTIYYTTTQYLLCTGSCYYYLCTSHKLSSVPKWLAVW